MSTTSTIEYLGNLRTQATHTGSGEQITTDAPTDNNGKGEYFSPTDLCATSLASCMLTIMGIKAESLGIDLGYIRVDCQKIMAANPRRISAVNLDLHLAGQFTDEHKQALEVAGLNCPVAKSLHPDIQQNIVFHWPDNS
jgi:uncharacterized OsmC-like protein